MSVPKHLTLFASLLLLAGCREVVTEPGWRVSQ